MSHEETPTAGQGDPDLADPVTTLQRERDELRDRLLRNAADFDNYRKRIDRERRDLSDAMTVDLVKDLLPVVDDLERALAAPVWQADPAARRGVELIHRQLLDALRKRGVEALDVMGKDFDPEWHEAVASEPAGDRREGEITAQIRRGYRAGNRLVRAAMVKVAKT
jgi:molecular chaperone GrpE